MYEGGASSTGLNLPSYDVVIVGAGITGLLAAKKFSGLGLRTALVESRSKVAPCSSSRNEGWLHNGTYHSYSIQDDTEARSVTEKCQYGHNQILLEVPEAIEKKYPTIAILKDKSHHEYLIGRWESFDVSHVPISPNELKQLVPEMLELDGISAFRVSDVGVNTRILYHKLLKMCQMNGVDILTSSTIDSVHGNIISINGVSHRTKSIVYATGYGTGKILTDLYGEEIVRDVFGNSNPFRYWKSHLMLTPRLTQNGVYVLDTGEMTLMNHGEYSIIGFNEDAVEVEIPDCSPDNSMFQHYLEILNKTIPYDGSGAELIACIKVDIREPRNLARSLNVSISEIAPNQYVALPGKMTEAPWLCDELVTLIFDRIHSDNPVSYRPVDIICQKVRANKIEIDEGNVIKTAASAVAASREVQLSNDYRNNPIEAVRVLEYNNDGLRIISKYEEYNNLMGFSDIEIGRKLVNDLAIFHSIYSVNETQVLYRDAMPSNYLLSNDGDVIHIDFSSSNRLIHAFDDLALLLNPRWSKLKSCEREELIDEYIRFRKEFNKFKGNGEFVDKLSTSTPVDYYQTIEEMKGFGINSRSLEHHLRRVDFKRLKREDFYYFAEYRRMRAEYYLRCVWNKGGKTGRNGLRDNLTTTHFVRL